MNKLQPLKVEIKDDILSISIGIDTLAWAFEHSQFAQPYDEDKGDYIQAFEVTDINEFAKEVKHELENEQEDGTTPLNLLLDKACEDAVGNGSIAIVEGKGLAKDL